MKNSPKWRNDLCKYDVLNNFEPDLILMDLSRSSSLESINDGVDVIKKFDAPLICISDDFNRRI